MDSKCLMYEYPGFGVQPIHVNEETAKVIREFLDKHFPPGISVTHSTVTVEVEPTWSHGPTYVVVPDPAKAMEEALDNLPSVITKTAMVKRWPAPPAPKPPKAKKK